MGDGDRKMVFDLSVELPKVEIKKPNVTIQDFLDVNDSMSEMLEEVFSVSHHLNLAELIVDEIRLNGDIKGIVVIDTFISSLKKLQDQYDTKWKGDFNVHNGEDEFRYKAPSFKVEQLN